MAYETAEQKRDRIHDEAANDAFGDVKPAPVKLPAAPAKPNEAVAVAKDLVRGGKAAAKGFSEAMDLSKPAGQVVEGVKRAGAGVAGGDIHEIGQGLRDTVMGALGIPMSVLTAPPAALTAYIDEL